MGDQQKPVLQRADIVDSTRMNQPSYLRKFVRCLPEKDDANILVSRVGFKLICGAGIVLHTYILPHSLAYCNQSSTALTCNLPAGNMNINMKTELRSKANSSL